MPETRFWKMYGFVKLQASCKRLFFLLKNYCKNKKFAPVMLNLIQHLPTFKTSVFPFNLF